MPFSPLVDPVPALSAAETTRTARHLRLAGFGGSAQRRLRAAHVAIVGAGGLGSPTILALAAAGIGRITIIDDDVVDVTNLHRQIIHRHADVGRAKTDSAERVASDLSPETVVHAVRARVDDDNASELIAGADLVLDGTDTFETREAVAAACERAGIPLVWGTVQAFDAQVTVFWSAPPAGVAPVVLRDLYPHGSVGDVPTCEDVGVLGVLCMQVGALMAAQAVALITGVGDPLLGRVVVIDGLRMRQREIVLRPAGDAAATATAGRTAKAPRPASVSVDDLRRALDSGAPPRIIDVRETHELLTGMVPTSVHTPLASVLGEPGSALSARSADGEPRVEQQPIVVVCQAGVRARRAAEALAGAGIEAVVLAGGMDAWHAAHRPAADRVSTEPTR